jgi:hypothetical protein
MMPYKIAYSSTLLQEIKKSHERSKQFGIDPNSTCNHDQYSIYVLQDTISAIKTKSLDSES